MKQRIALRLRGLLSGIADGDPHVSLIVGGAARAFSIQVLGMALAFGTQVLLARWLGPTQYGIYGLVLAWVVLLSVISNLGFPLTLLRFIPQYRRQRSERRLVGLMRVGYGSTLIAAILVALVGVGFVVSNAEMDPTTRSAFLVGLWIVPVLTIAEIQSGAARAFGRTLLALMPPRVGRPVFVVSGAFLLLVVQGSITSVNALAASVAAVLIVTFWQGIALARSWRSSFEPSYEPAVWRGVAVPLWMLAVFQLVSNRADVLVVGGFLSPDDVAVYVAASRTATLATLALAAVTVLAAPTFASLQGDGDKDDLARVAVSTTRLAFWPTLAIVLVLVAFGDQVLALFGPEFVRGRWVLAILAIGQLFNAGVGAVGSLLNMTGHQKDSLRVFATTAGINLVLSIFLVPRLGLMGAALSTAVTTVLWNLWLHRLVYRRLGIRMWVLNRSPRS
jgi:O-antigen/teichoic acid export membrane protein